MNGTEVFWLFMHFIHASLRYVLIYARYLFRLQFSLYRGGGSGCASVFCRSYTEFPNKRADQNKRVRREDFFIYCMKNESIMENFLICCMKNWKYGGKFFKKKLSEHAHLLGSSDYLLRQRNTWKYWPLFCYLQFAHPDLSCFCHPWASYSKLTFKRHWLKNQLISKCFWSLTKYKKSSTPVNCDSLKILLNS